MTEPEIYEKLNVLFRSFMNNPAIALTPQTVATDIPGWDSMTHVQIIIKVEELFGIRFKHAEIAAFENVGDLVAAVLRRKGAAA
ncbi:MAG: acyl carrier protein [Proteobacteria bacterium]|nr:acyl carrier protein [Pseudomonadota bacterium]